MTGLHKYDHFTHLLQDLHWLRVPERINVLEAPVSSLCHVLLLLLLRTLVGLRGSAVERQSLASVLSPSCARPVADG